MLRLTSALHYAIPLMTLRVSHNVAHVHEAPHTKYIHLTSLHATMYNVL